MKITIGLTQVDVDAIRIMRMIADTKVKYFTEKELSKEGLAQGEAWEFDNWLDRQRLFRRMEVLIDNANDAAKPCKMKMIPGLHDSMDTEDWKTPGQAKETEIPARRKILSDKEKKGLRDEDVFMQEYGLYTGFVADEYWSNIFKAIYGYSPSLL